LEKIFGRKIALLGVIFIGLSPILVGISTILNPDSLLWIFTSLSVLSYFTYLKEKKSSFLVFSGIFLGLSLLTKYVANILFIFFFGMIFLEYIFEKENYKNTTFRKYFRLSAVNLIFLSF
jgi:4-amino-4-deoxy-L-arabinose transferase-like glycosyltransferase